MSADFWGWCPLCIADARVEMPGATVEDVLPMVGRYAREDYEIGLDGNGIGDPNIRMIYKVTCERCGAKASLDTTIRMQR